MIEKIRGHAELFDVPSQAVIATTLEGRIVYWSDAAARLYGWAESEALDRDILDVTPSDLTREQGSEIMEHLRRGETWSGNFGVRSRTGRDFIAHVRDVPVHDDSGNLIGIIGISQRATAR